MSVQTDWESKQLIPPRNAGAHWLLKYFTCLTRIMLQTCELSVVFCSAVILNGIRTSLLLTWITLLLTLSHYTRNVLAFLPPGKQSCFPLQLRIQDMLRLWLKLHCKGSHLAHVKQHLQAKLEQDKTTDIMLWDCHLASHQLCTCSHFRMVYRSLSAIHVTSGHCSFFTKMWSSRISHYKVVWTLP